MAKRILPIIVGVLLIVSGADLFAQAAVQAKVLASKYSVGDIVPVQIVVKTNPGMHGLYFDMDYNGAVFAFESIVEGDLTGGYPQKGEIKYAASGYKPGPVTQAHLVVSYTLQGRSVETKQTGQVLEARFRVMAAGTPDTDYSFGFSACGMINGAGTALAGVTWQTSTKFKINNPNAGAYIVITKPYYYQVFHKEDVTGVDADDPFVCFTKMSVNLTEGDYYVKLYNEAVPGRTVGPLHVTAGFLLDQRIPLQYDFNTLVAELYDSAAMTNKLATDTVKVYLSRDDQFVSIESPSDHSLLNSDTVRVKVKSTFTSVEVNGLSAAFNGEKEDGKNVFYATVWLKPGFNTITAVAYGPQEPGGPAPVRYTHTITVYYQKDTEIFRFLLPQNGASFKPDGGDPFVVKGEIGSRYKESTGFAETSVENVVTLDAVYTPTDRTRPVQTLVANQRLKIEENAYGYDGAQAKYVFRNDFAIPLSGLDGGEISLAVFKNRQGETWDDKITRVVYVDNNRLWINLVQPNVTASDVLDTPDKLTGFNETHPISADGSIALGTDGALALANPSLAIESQNVTGLRAIVESPEGTIYGIKNQSGNLILYQKALQDLSWKEAVRKSGFYGYSLLWTDMGLMITGSNLFSGTDSGIYIYRDNKLSNIRFSESLPHVQFAVERSGTVYFYGNYYNYLYGFDSHAIQWQTQGYYSAGALSKVSFPNNSNVKDFILSRDLTTAVLRVEHASGTDAVLFYNKTATGYSLAVMPKLNESAEIFGAAVVYGEYDGGAYETYLILKNDSEAETVMREKSGGQYYRNAVAGTLSRWIQGLEAADPEPKTLTDITCSFTDSLFHFMYKSGGVYYRRAGQVFFSRFFTKIAETQLGTPATAIQHCNSRLFITYDDTIYLGFDGYPNGSEPDQPLTCIRQKYTKSGSALFNYVNDAVEGLTGFGFEVDSRWLDLDGVLPNEDSPIEFGFSVLDASGTKIISVDRYELNKFLVEKQAAFTISHTYDANKGRRIVYVSFTELQKGSSLRFDLRITPVGEKSPAIHNLSIGKRIPVYMTRTGETELTLPIHGYVYDRTVDKVSVNNNPIIIVQRDGSFYHDYKIISSKNEETVSLSCMNGKGEIKSLDFQVRLIDSLKKIGNTGYNFDASTVYEPLIAHAGAFQIDTNKDLMYLSGSYYGLAGAVVGYEIQQEQAGVWTPLARALFETKPDRAVFVALGLADPGDGYAAGRFQGQAVKLIPGLQRLVFYVENPGERRLEYLSDGLYPTVNYNMSAVDQKIEFDIEQDLTGVVTDSVPITKLLPLQATESEDSPAGSNHFTFKAAYEVKGDIKTLYSTNLIVRSYTNGLTLEGGVTQKTVTVDSAGRFSFSVYVTMDGSLAKNFDVGVIPDSPSLTSLRNGFRVSVKKSFLDTRFIPDLAAMFPDKWTQAEKDSKSVGVRMTFNRTDVPVVKLVYATVTLNYEVTKSGWVTPVKDAAGLYYLTDDSGAAVTLPVTKEGRNRLSWRLQFQEGSGLISMSSSVSGKPGMFDYFFEYHPDVTVYDTVIGFSEDLTGKFYGTVLENSVPKNVPLPTLTITKDKGTLLTAALNGTALSFQWTTNGGQQLAQNFVLPTSALKQGRNELVVSYKQGTADGWETKSYGFLYDTQNPAVSVESYKFNSDDTVLREISVLVTEANYKEAFLYVGPSIENSVPALAILGEGKYRLTWTNLAVTPAINPVKVEVADLTGKRAATPPFSGLAAMPRPVEPNLREQAITMPLYNGTPQTDNEDLYTAKIFSQHTKLAPEMFLRKKSILSTLSTNGNALIPNEDKDLYAYYDTNNTSGNYTDDRFYFLQNGTPVFLNQNTFPGMNFLVPDSINNGSTSGTVNFSIKYYLSGRTFSDFIDHISFLHQTGINSNMQLITGFTNVADLYNATSLSALNSIPFNGSAQDGDGLKAHTINSNYLRTKTGVSRVLPLDAAFPEFDGTLKAAFIENVLMAATFETLSPVNFTGIFYIDRDADGSGVSGFDSPPITLSVTGYNFPSTTTIYPTNNVYSWALNSSQTLSLGTINSFSGYYRGGTTAGSVKNGKFKRTAKIDDTSVLFYQMFIPNCFSQFSWSAQGVPSSGSGEYNNYLFAPTTTPSEASYGEKYTFTGITMPNNQDIQAFKLPEDQDTNHTAKMIVSSRQSLADINAHAADLVEAEGYGSYLVIKVGKTEEIQDVSDISDQGRIKFRFTSSTEDASGQATQALGQDVTLNNGTFFYVNDEKYIYYVVKISELKTQLNTMYTSVASMFDSNTSTVMANKHIKDRGSLRIVYTNLTPADVFITGNTGTPVTEPKNLPMFDPKYQDTNHTNPDTDIPVHPSLLIPRSNGTDNDRSITITHAPSIGSRTFCFWMRPEDADITNPVNEDTEKLKRIFTFTDNTGAEIGYLGYERNNLCFYDEQNYPKRTVLTTLNVDTHKWNFITLRIDYHDHAYHPILAVNVNDGGPIVVPNVNMPDKFAAILADNAGCYFGHADADLYNTGFFSIAKPFYIDRLLTEDEIARYAHLLDGNQGSEFTFDFGTSDDGFGQPTDMNVLHRPTDCGVNYHTTTQNSKFTELSSGAFKASSENKNMFKRHPIENGEEVILATAAEHVLYNIAVTADSAKPGFFTLAPNGTGARYYFGDKNGNYGLKTNPYYSISGFVDSLEDGASAKLVLRINGQAQSCDLKPGAFHFVYDNTAGLAPEDVKVYLETTGRIVLRTDLVFNLGNYIIPEDLNKTYATMRFPFDRSGTVSFWYKPLTANAAGFVNYASVIFDGEYLRIGSEIPAGETEAVFYTYIKKQNGTADPNLTFHSKVKVRNGWQYVQLSYSCDYDVAYFYVNDTLAGWSEATALPEYGSILAQIPEGDNVWLGSDRSVSTFAEGYIDDLYIGKYYWADSKYEDRKPLTVSYDVVDSQLEVSYATGVVADNAKTNYRLETLDGQLIASGNEFPVVVSSLPGGRYRLVSNFTLNNYRHTELFTFNIDNRPRFILKEMTPLLFTDTPLDLKFKFSFDPSSRFANQSLEFAGVAVRITYNQGATKTKYLVQDFIDQNEGKWLVGEEASDGAISWTPLDADNGGDISLAFSGDSSTTAVTATCKYFYFQNVFTDDQKYDHPGTTVNQTYTIPIAQLNCTVDSHKLIVKVVDALDNVRMDTGIFKQIQIGCHVVETNPEFTKDTIASLNNQGTAELYFDDILPQYGTYTCTLDLKYNGIPYLSRQLADKLVWEKPKTDDDTRTTSMDLKITRFNLLYVDQKADKAGFYVEYTAQSVGAIDGWLEVYDANGHLFKKTDEVNLTYQSTGLASDHIFDNISIPKGAVRVEVILEAENFLRTKRVSFSNDTEAPEVVILNGVDANITYNNVTFSWKGYYKGAFSPDIAYTYNFDDAGWATQNKEWREARFYNLAEGYHSFRLKAVYNGKESIERSQTFFVDVQKPAFVKSKLTVQKFYDEKNIFYAVKISGADGAIQDVSLRYLYVEGTKVDVTPEGKFTTGLLTLTKDGANKFVFTAYDKVNNFTDYAVTVDNDLTALLYPADGKVPYAPMTLVGRVLDTVKPGISLYLRDPLCQSKADGDFSGWRKATINEDRTFFIEDVYVNPGSASQALATPLTLAVVFDNGRTFTKEIEMLANEIVAPIELTFSTHAVEGENADTEITIDCRANVPDISSWSIDFNGDGVYDDTVMVDDPAGKAALSRRWVHMYSSLGLVSPRVRIITREGRFFSVSDELIIHEKVRDASPMNVTNPISLSRVRTPINTEKLFILRKNSQDFLLDIYTIPQFDPQPYASDDPINLSDLSVKNPVRVRALDEGRLYVAGNDEGVGTVYELEANQFGNYSVTTKLNVSDEIRDITVDKSNVYVSLKNRNALITVQIVNGRMDSSTMREVVPSMENSQAVGRSAGVSAEETGLILADYWNTRLVRLSTGLVPLEQFGSLGDGEGQFVKPAWIKSYGNRVFVYDEARKDIQVFDSHFNLLCTLRYSPEPGYHNYVEGAFFNDVADFDVIVKEEGTLLYYYALVLSKSSGKLAVLRLPQWEEMRARVRNNKLVYVKNGEVYTSKPDGGDLLKVLSSDALPRIEGTLDYPALSPDGRTLVFTSRVVLFSGGDPAGDASYGYANMYTYNIETKRLTLLNLGAIAGYAVERPVFSSNGDKLIFSARSAATKWQIYTLDLASGLVEKLFSSQENARFPYYSPDDRFVVFTTDYDGDMDIEIVDTRNTDMRTVVSKNSARDSLPVWSAVYPDETSNDKVTSKIAFVSERDFMKAVYCVYMLRYADSDVRVYNLYTGHDGGEPDAAAIRLSRYFSAATNGMVNVEGDYPAFTGDGSCVAFETYDNSQSRLKKFDFNENKDEIANSTNPHFVLHDLETIPAALLAADPAYRGMLYGARRPSGMKNMITGFTARNINGDELELRWSRYTSSDIFYYVELKSTAESNPEPVIKKVSSQNGATLKGLEMGQEYKVRVYVEENEEIVTTSQWRTVKLPKVGARPSYTIDPNNPYLVRLHAWKPKPEDDWSFVWIVDNQEYNASTSQDYAFEFGTSGTKTVMLKATGGSGAAQETRVSEPFEVKIVSDIRPVIEYVLAANSGSVELTAANSLGKRIDLAKTAWTISGRGAQARHETGSSVIVDLTGFMDKINVTVTLARVPVNNQPATDVVEKTILVDLKLTDVRPIITYEAAEENPRTVTFSGQQSIGNIDWYNAAWTVFADGEVIYSVKGVSSFIYQFPPRGRETVYTATLSVPRRNDNQTATVSQFISIEPAVIEPKIDAKVLTYTSGGNTVVAKLLLDCSQSKGSGIDFTNAKWSVPGAGAYGESPTQFGPVAVYTLSNFGADSVLEVALTLSRKGGQDPVTFSQFVTANGEAVQKNSLVVTPSRTKTTDGTLVTLDVLKSTGPNINWENTEWLITTPLLGSVTKRGPTVQVTVPASAEKTIVSYTVTLYRYGGAAPETETETIDVDSLGIIPIITATQLSGACYKLTVLESKGVNIDWERTMWYIFDGNTQVVQVRGSNISHNFLTKEGAMGYPVMVEMYLKGSSYPFVWYQSLQIEGDLFEPIITYDIDANDPNLVTFYAITSMGSNVDLSRAKWTLGDGSQDQYGPVVSHKFPVGSEGKEYKVTLVLTRNAGTTSEETKSVFQTVKMGSDVIKPKVKAAVYDDMLVLSATDSEGRGLLLDRAIWYFPGQGDSSQHTVNNQEGVIEKNSHTFKTDAGVEYQFGSELIPTGVLKISAGIGYVYNYERTSYDNFKNNTDQFTTSNSNMGPVCRRYVGTQKEIIVSLFVYRVNSDGRIEGEEIVVRINLSTARSAATGMVYGQ